jgi:hypothetical protein
LEKGKGIAKTNKRREKKKYILKDQIKKRRF